MKRKGLTSLLGLAFDGSRLTAALAHLGGKQVQIRQVLNAPFDLDPRATEPELVGLEIRNLLRQANIRERRCVVCVPLSWTLSMQVAIPDLPENEVANFLAVRAERELPFSSGELVTAASRFHPDELTQAATLAAIPANHLTALTRALKTARLKVVTITLGVSSLRSAPVESNQGMLMFLLGDAAVDLAVVSGGGVASLRQIAPVSVDSAQSSAGGSAAALARELRITLGQLSENMRQAVRRVEVYGTASSVAPVVENLRERFGGNSLDIESGHSTLADSILDQTPGGASLDKAPAAAAAAAQVLLGQPLPFEFEVVMRSAAKAFFNRVMSRKTLWFSSAAVLLVLGAFGLIIPQKMKLERLRTEYTKISPQVKKVEALRDQIRALSPWFSNDPEVLEIVRVVNEAFPPEGPIWISRLEIKNFNAVTISGKAQSRDEWMALKDRLSQTKGVTQLTSDSRDASGNEPLTFAVAFKWNPNPGGAK
ncbi:MAG TPA: hypothetical protein PLA90_01785 [Candidatus Sumerlaeota bacterium]|nr:hypothetical protein [Candidatus Sumerlaeota bacterium]HPS00250.1 hypothetical protein [Candidatus Sumerlaeota bacterium]